MLVEAFKYGAVSQEASAIVDGIIGIPHIEMNPSNRRVHLLWDDTRSGVYQERGG